MPASRLLFLVGPTASGKSELAIELAKTLNGEIISCDSMLVYRGMKIGTAKLSMKERKGIQHHCMDLITPRQKFSVSDFRKVALDAVKKIEDRNRQPIVVGGSGLYLEALLDGIPPQVTATTKIRQALERVADEQGLHVLYDELKKADVTRSSEISPNDRRRIIRSLEIYRALGIRPSVWRESRQSLEDLGYGYAIFGLMRDRRELYDRVERRVDLMLEKGLVREVKRIKNNGFSLTARQAIGYAEILSYLDGGISLEHAAELMKKRTRHLAKKQLTWFRHEKRIQWVSVKGNEHLSKAKQLILKKWRMS